MDTIEEKIFDEICLLLRKDIDNLLAIYAFGSRVRGDANASSDLDVAVLTAGYIDSPILLWELSTKLPDLCRCEVDLLDFRRASTVMQNQVLMQGKRLWCLDSQADLYEAAVLSEKIYLNEARGNTLDDIRESGRVYGR